MICVSYYRALSIVPFCSIPAVKYTTLDVLFTTSMYFKNSSSCFFEPTNSPWKYGKSGSVPKSITACSKNNVSTNDYGVTVHINGKNYI